MHILPRHMDQQQNKHEEVVLKPLLSGECCNVV